MWKYKFLNKEKMLSVEIYRIVRKRQNVYNRG